MSCIRRSPVRPTLLRHMKHLFFLGLGVSPLPSSLLEEATEEELEAAGWFTTTHEERKQGGDSLISQARFKLCTFVPYDTNVLYL